MRRRAFLCLAGAMVTLGPAGAASPKSDVRTLGFLSGASEADRVTQSRLAAFLRALSTLGWAEGRNLRVHARWAVGDVERLQLQAKELVQLQPDVILAHGTAPLKSLKGLTTSTPIVFVVVNDPVAQGIVSNIGRPGGNITGFSLMDYSVIGKALDLLKQAAPSVSRVGFLFDPKDYPYYEQYLTSLATLRETLKIDIKPLRAHSAPEIEAAIADLAREPNSAVISPPSIFSLVHRKIVIEQTKRHRMPAVMSIAEAVKEGGLMSYAPDQTEMFERAASYVDRILNGDVPGDLPIQAPTKFELVVNLKTARELDLTIPPTLLAIADALIE